MHEEIFEMLIPSLDDVGGVVDPHHHALVLHPFAWEEEQEVSEEEIEED